MATSITIDSANASQHGSYQGRHLTLKVEITSQDTALNRSYIKWTLTSTGGSSTYYTVGPTTVKIGGWQAYYIEQKSYSTRVFPAATGSVSGTTYFDHSSDGTLTLTVSLTTAVYYEGVGTVSSSWTLNSIPRGSTINTIPAFNVEDSISCTITKNVSSYSDTLALKYGSTTIKTITNYTSGATFTLTDAEILNAYKAMGTAKSGNFTFTVTTYNGSTQIGSANSKTGTGTCAGTFRFNDNGTWRRALPWINVDGTWYKALAKITPDGTNWYRGR